MAQSVTPGVGGTFCAYASNGLVGTIFYDPDTAYWYLLVSRAGGGVRSCYVYRTTDPDTVAWSLFTSGTTTIGGASTDPTPMACIIKDNAAASTYWVLLTHWVAYDLTVWLHKLVVSGSGTFTGHTSAFFSGAGAYSGKVKFGNGSMDQTSTHIYILSVYTIEAIMGNRYQRTCWGKYSKSNWLSETPTLQEVGTTVEAGQETGFGVDWVYTWGNYIFFARRQGTNGSVIASTRNHTSSDSVTQDGTTLLTGNYAYGIPTENAPNVSSLCLISSTQLMTYCSTNAALQLSISSGVVSLAGTADPPFSNSVLGAYSLAGYRSEVWALGNYDNGGGSESVATSVYMNGAWTAERVSPVANFDMPTTYQAFLVEDGKGLRAVSVVPDATWDATTITTDWVSVVSDRPPRKFPSPVMNF